jgi:hypothetical protein
MKNLDLSRLKGITFYCIISPHTEIKCCETTYEGDTVNHTHITADGTVKKCQGKISLSDATRDEDRSVVEEYEGGKRIEFKVLDTDYETYMIKVTERGTFLCMNEPEPAEEKVKKFKVVGERDC